MTAIYDNKPSKLEAVGNGSYLYRYNIKETERPTIEGDETLTQWECGEVTVWSPVTANKITQAVIAERWPNDYEQKLVNEYNGAQLGVYGSKTSAEAKAKIKAYTDFLAERNTLKAAIDADCKELGVN